MSTGKEISVENAEQRQCVLERWRGGFDGPQSLFYNVPQDDDRGVGLLWCIPPKAESSLKINVKWKTQFSQWYNPDSPLTLLFLLFFLSAPCIILISLYFNKNLSSWKGLGAQNILNFKL